MELSINYWNEITEFLNGYVLEDVKIAGNSLIAINSQKETFVLATRTRVFWTPVYGKSFEAVDVILRQINDSLKDEGIYDLQKKDQAVVESLKKIIQLYSKYQK